MHRSRHILAVTLVSLALPFAAHANTIEGSVFCNISSADANNTPAPGITPTSGTLCATFESSGINFNNPWGTNSIGTFLNSNNLIIGSVNYLNGFDASSSLDYSLFRFTGFGAFQNGQTYSATHDDGTVMSVNGVTVINEPGPTPVSTDTFTWTGDSGNYNFEYDFTEAQGSTVYATDATNSPVPEPSSALLLGSGLVMAYSMRRKVFGLAC